LHRDRAVDRIEYSLDAGLVLRLAGGGASPRGIWRRAWPIFVISIVVGMAFVAWGDRIAP
jgi:hypothetical protein